jgi:hypothetical protein
MFLDKSRYSITIIITMAAAKRQLHHHLKDLFLLDASSALVSTERRMRLITIFRPHPNPSPEGKESGVAVK